MPSFMRRPFGLVLASFAVPVALYACASDDYTPPGPKSVPAADAATPTESGLADAPTVDAPVDQSTTVPVRCTDAEFAATAGDAGGDNTTVMAIDVTFPTGAGPAQYTNHCLKVKSGTVVTFKGNFGFHPLERNGGDPSTPIPALTNTGDTLAVTLPAAGTFGYECMFHPGLMFGAIQVVP